MNLSEQQLEKLEAESSASATVVGATMLSLLLAFPSFAPEAVAQEEFLDPGNKIVITRNASSSSSEPIYRSDNRYAEIMGAMGKVYDTLSASQIDLDETAERVLYQNLWDLYE